MWSYWFEEGIIRFAGLLEQEEQEEQEEDWRAVWINLHLAKVWTIPISETCLYILAELFASTFQPQYVDGLLNPIHKILSFTTELATLLGRALSVWDFSWFIFSFCIVSSPFCHLGTPFQSDYTLLLPSLGSFWPFLGFFSPFVSFSSEQSGIQACVRGLLHWTVASHSRVALIDSREYTWKLGIFKVKFLLVPFFGWSLFVSGCSLWML